MADAKADLLAWLGKTKTSARRVMSQYLKTVSEDARLMEHTRLQTLAQHHPNRRFPSNAVFVLRRCPPYFTPALSVEAKSGGYVDFSWIKCVDNIYGGYDKAKVARSNILAALRNEAFRSDAMQEARAGLGDVCANCEAKCKKLVVDHAEKPFAKIVDEFLEEQEVALMDLKVRCSRGDGFRLKALGKLWRKFHDENATLVGLCAKCNCSLGSRGYRHTKA